MDAHGPNPASSLAKASAAAPLDPVHDPEAESPPLFEDRSTLPLQPPTSAKLPPEPPAEAPGPLPPFGKFERLRKVAQGGMGIVYEARETPVGRIVALKVIRSGALAEGEEIERFLREARAVSQLHHPNVIPVYEIGEIDGLPFFTMPFIAGGSLAREFQRFVGNPRVVVALVEKIARGVQHAHDNGILHRDLKPSNVLLDQGDEPLVSDFGLAKFENASVDLTQSGQRLGTPAYMAPEQAAGKNNQVSAKTDVWALGVILYELLSGRRPFPGEREEILHKIVKEEPESLRSSRSHVDRSLETIVLKCLEKEPGRRYTDGELADDLARWQRGEPILARPLSWWGRLRRSTRRHPAWSVTVLLALVLPLAVLWAFILLDPERLLKTQILPRLASGEAVSLIDAGGNSIWWRWRVPGVLREPKGNLASLEPGFTFQSGARTLALVELLPKAEMETFQFHAEVRHPTGSHGQVGIYLAHEAHAGAAHSFVLLAFADFGNDARDPKGAARGQATASLVHFSPNRPWTTPLNQKPLAMRKFRPAWAETAAPPPRIPWRKLGVTVSVDAITFYWEGEQMARLSHKEVLERAKFITSRLKGTEVLPAMFSTFSPQGGLGLYAYDSTASFRNVRIEPFAER